MSGEIDPEARMFLLERLREFKVRGEKIPCVLVAQIAKWVGRSERTVWRWVGEAERTSDAGRRLDRRYRLTDRDRELFFGTTTCTGPGATA